MDIVVEDKKTGPTLTIQWLQALKNPLVVLLLPYPSSNAISNCAAMHLLRVFRIHQPVGSEICCSNLAIALINIGGIFFGVVVRTAVIVSLRKSYKY